MSNQDSLRLINVLDVETKTEKFLGCRDTSQDWAENVDTETPMRLLLTSAL